MRITKQQLKQLIKEEVKLILEQEESMDELLALVGLSRIENVAEEDPDIREALELWHSGIISHEETLDRLGGHSFDKLTHKEFRRVFEYLYNACCSSN